MPSKVALDFVPPDTPDIAALIIYEGPTNVGPFTQLERITAIGAYPDYITRYTTVLAASATDWFAIAWEDTAGHVGDLSQSIQGGTGTVVQKLIDRVRDRDSTLSERVVAQEAESAIQQVFGDGQDPYDPSLAPSYRQLSGLTYLVMARALIVRHITESATSVASATLGLISFKNQSGTLTSQKINVQDLIDLANKDLGIATSAVLILDEISQPTYPTYDHSRLVSGWLAIE